MSKNQYRTSKSKLEKTPCPYCNQYDGTIQNLRRHIEDKHPGKPYKRKGESDILESFSKQQKKKENPSFLSPNLSPGQYSGPSPSYVSPPLKPGLFHDPVQSTHGQSDDKVDISISEVMEKLKDMEKKTDNALIGIKEAVEDIKVKIDEKPTVNKPKVVLPENVPPTDTRLSLMDQCYSCEDIIENFVEIEERSRKNPGGTVQMFLVCMICNPSNAPLPQSKENGRFDYIEFSLDSEGKMTKEFRNLKVAIKRHMKYQQNHLQQLKQVSIKEEKEKIKMQRNYEIGMRCGRIAYSGFKKGSSYRTFETNVLLAVQNGLDMGEINNSKNFPEKFLPHVTKEVNKLVGEFFQNRLKQTGFLPAMNIQADKGTNVHRSRQFTTAVVVVPDSENLLVNIYLGQPVVKDHTAVGLASSIRGEIERNFIKSEQIEGFSGDGQYIKWNVPQILQTQMNLSHTFIASWDPLHRSGVVDTHIRKDSKFFWMVDVQNLCKSIYTKFNWGKNYEHLIEVCEELEVRMAKLANFSTTRFSNSIKNVTINVRKDFKAIIKCLHDIVKDLKDKPSTENNTKCEDAERILKAIENKQFVLYLSGISDLYEIFGEVANVCQTVDLLPHERYDITVAIIEKFKKMNDCIKHDKCVEISKKESNSKLKDAETINCLWPRYHSDLNTLQKSQKYMDHILPLNYPSKSKETRSFKQDEAARLTKDFYESVEVNLKVLNERLYNDLKKEMFTEDVKTKIDIVREVCDVASMAVDVKSKGAVLVGLNRAENFVKSVRLVTNTLDGITKTEIKDSFKKFLVKLEVHVQNIAVEKLDSKLLIKNFLKSDKKLYEEVEVIMHCFSVAAVKLSVESSVESLVSRYEKHFDKTRQLTEEHAKEEMIIAENGPILVRADPLIKRALDSHFKEHNNQQHGRWHFTMSENIKTHIQESKVIKKLKNERSKLPFMEN